MSKDFLRAQILKSRTQLSAGEVAARSQRIFDTFKIKFNHQIDRQKVKVIALYYPVKGEVETRKFFDFFKKEKYIPAFPKIVSDTLEFFPVLDFAELIPAQMGIMEPRTNERSKSIRPDLIFVPGIAFDKKGFRLGYGAGYYDRYLSTNPAQTIGLAYEFQVVDEIPEESHDIPLNFVLSEKHLFEFKKH